MEEMQLGKISILGPTLASLIQRFNSSSTDIDGLLFGRVYLDKPFNLTDDEPCSTRENLSLVSIVTSFFSSTATTSFYDSSGRFHSSFPLLSDLPQGSVLLGWFSGRRKTPRRPSMREYSVSHSLASLFNFSLPADNSRVSVDFKPCIFFLFTTPLSDQVVCTNEYRAYKYYLLKDTLEFNPLSVEIANLGPDFRGHYGQFSPNSTFPSLPCQLRGSGSSMVDAHDTSLNEMKRVVNDQMVLDASAEGFPIQNLSRLVGPEAGDYTSRLDDLYQKMILKLEVLAHRVEKTSIQVSAMENRNMELRESLL